MMVPKALFFSAVGGFVFGMAVPPCRLFPLAWIGVAPLLFANTFPLRWEQRLFSALLWGLCVALPPLITSFWFTHRQGIMSPSGIVDWLLVLQPFFFAAFVVGVVALLAGELWKDAHWTGWQWIFGVTALGVLVEWFSLRLPLPIHLALTQHQNLPLLQWASVGGIWLVSAFVWFTNATFTFFSLTGSWGPLLAAFIIILSAHGFGLLFRPPLKGTVSVALIQPDTDDPLRMAEKVQGAQLLVLPELALGQESFLTRSVVEKVARRTGAYLVVGIEEPNGPFNAAALFAPDGKEIGRYRKVHLFGGERWYYRKGKGSKVIETPFGKIGMAICFDTAFPYIARQSAKKGAKILAVPNFDPPAAGFLLHYLHAAFFPFRAVEGRFTIVKADGTGLSQVFAPDGRIIEKAPLGQPTVLKAQAPIASGLTLYARLGDWLVWLLGLFMIALGLYAYMGMETEKIGVKT